jgi:hypothetical protein
MDAHTLQYQYEYQSGPVVRDSGHILIEVILPLAVAEKSINEDWAPSSHARRSRCGGLSRSGFVRSISVDEPALLTRLHGFGVVSGSGSDDQDAA